MDPFYRAFEERYRGSRELIASRLKVYLPFAEPLKSIYVELETLDLGCGRGEWLELMQRNGFRAKGVDLDEGMLLACRELNLDVCQADAIDYLRGLAADTMSVISAFHVVEHISFEALRQLVNEAHRVLKPGGLLILETPNSENLVVGSSTFYMDPTHQRPLPAQLLGFVVEYTGFVRVKTLYLQESLDLATKQRISLFNVLEGVSPDYAIVAQKNATADVFLKFDEPFERAYGIRLESLATSYDQQTEICVTQAQWLQNEWDTAKQRIEEFSKNTGRLETELTHLQNHSQWLQNEYNKLQTHAQCIQNELNTSIAKVHELNKERQNIYASTSWRITWPLRKIMQAAKWTMALPARTVRWTLRLPKRLAGRNVTLANSHSYSTDTALQDPVTTACEQNISDESINTLSPRAASIYAELKKAIEARKN